jgi:hypothetical protein
MNELNFSFSDLYKKIQAIDESVVEPKDELSGGAGASDECGGSMSPKGVEAPLMGEEAVEECGMDMMARPMSSPKQSDSVTMNVSMNGSGSGGIKDLMQILRNIESGSEPTNPHPVDAKALFGDEEEGVSEEQQAAHDGKFGDATTSPNEVTLDIDSVIPTGNDMHSKGGEAEKVNGGGNPYNSIDESLKFKLFNMYNEIKGQ